MPGAARGPLVISFDALDPDPAFYDSIHEDPSGPYAEARPEGGMPGGALDEQQWTTPVVFPSGAAASAGAALRFGHGSGRPGAAWGSAYESSSDHPWLAGGDGHVGAGSEQDHPRTQPLYADAEGGHYGTARAAEFMHKV